MPNIDENLAFAPATELRALIADGEITSTELTELYLSRIEKLDDQLHAFLTVTPEIALEQAAKADAATARGESLGPLHGLPISIKDLQMTKGVRTTGGSLVYKDRVPDANAAYIDNIFDAGAVMLGKTNTPSSDISAPPTTGLAHPAATPGTQNVPPEAPAEEQAPHWPPDSAHSPPAATAADPYAFQPASTESTASNPLKDASPATPASTHPQPQTSAASRAPCPAPSPTPLCSCKSWPVTTPAMPAPCALPCPTSTPPSPTHPP